MGRALIGSEQHADGEEAGRLASLVSGLSSAQVLFRSVFASQS